MLKQISAIILAAVLLSSTGSLAFTIIMRNTASTDPNVNTLKYYEGSTCQNATVKTTRTGAFGTLSSARLANPTWSDCVYATFTNNSSVESDPSNTVILTKAAPTLAWSQPASIRYGTALSGTQLNPTAKDLIGGTVSGSWSYNPTSGTVLAAGSHTLSATFTPTDSTAWSSGTVTTTLTVVAVDAPQIRVYNLIP